MHVVLGISWNFAGKRFLVYQQILTCLKSTIEKLENLTTKTPERSQ